MALLKPFLSGEILFSSISTDYELNLKNELYACFKYIGIPFDILNKMTVRDRKFYIAKHNNQVAEENKEKDNSTYSGSMLDKFTDLAQSNKKNWGGT